MTDRSRFRVATFNANSLRARLHIIIPWLLDKQVDVLCIQETKVQDQDFPEDTFEKIGYHVVFRGQKSYNGVAIASRHPVEGISFGFNDNERLDEDEARLIRCKIDGIHLVNTYVPQGKAIDHPHYQMKLRWFDRLKKLFETDYSPDENVLWCGDINVAPEPLDVYAPGKKLKHVCFHEAIRKALAKVREWGFIDLFRKFHPNAKEYTFYDYRIRNAVKNGLGWRIDQIYTSRPLAAMALDCWIDLEPRLAEKPSDHTFLVADFDLDH